MIRIIHKKVLEPDCFISKNNMNIKNTNKSAYLLRKILFKVMGKISNEDNCAFKSNGELSLLRDIKKFYQNVPQSLVIFDVGANIGEYSEHLERIFSSFSHTLHIFEPTQSCFDLLTKKFGKSSNIYLNRTALSDHSGDATIYFDEQGSGLASLHKRDISLYKNPLSHEERVKITTLDSYLSERSVSHIHFLKLDVEGHELSVLRGMGDFLKDSFVDFVQFEYGGCNLDSRTTLRDFISLFEGKGFSVYKLMPTYLEKFSYDSLYENFRYSNYVAISKKLISL